MDQTHAHPPIHPQINQPPRRERLEREGGAGGKRNKKDKGVFSAGRGSTVLTETEALEAINYRPRHPESKRAYEEMLSLIQGNIGDQPQDILRGAADEVLAILKDEKLTDPRRQAEIERLIRRLPPDRFAKLVTLGKAIHDFHTVRACGECVRRELLSCMSMIGSFKSTATIKYHRATAARARTWTRTRCWTRRWASAWSSTATRRRRRRSRTWMRWWTRRTRRTAGRR